MIILKRLISFIRNYYIDNFLIPSPKKSLENLKKLGFSPKTIFDVGAYEGDFAELCLNIWTDVHITCFEGQSPKIQLLNKYYGNNQNITIIEGLVGERDDNNVSFNENATASSVLTEHISTNFTQTTKKMFRLDNYCNDNKIDTPQLLKIDTQGYEYQVLQGFEKRLGNVEVILAELNMIDIHKDVKLAHEVIDLLINYGFVIYDICELHRRPIDNALWQADFIFVKSNSNFRQNKKW